MNDTTATTTARGLQLPCPHCGEQNANIYLDMANLEFKCQENDCDFTADDVREFIAKWSKVLKWVDSFPAE